MIAKDNNMTVQKKKHFIIEVGVIFITRNLEFFTQWPAQCISVNGGKKKTHNIKQKTKQNKIVKKSKYLNKNCVVKDTDVSVLK